MYQNTPLTYKPYRNLLLVLALTLSTAFALLVLSVTGAQAHEGQVHVDDYRHELKASLTGAQEVPPVVASTTATTSPGTSSTTGSASFKVHNNKQSISYDLQVQNGDDITAAHLHCALAGQNGPIAVPLFSIASGTDINGTLATGTITAANLTSNCVDKGITTFAQLIDAMEEGEIYVNVHSVAHPNGVVRGQLMLQAHEHETDNDGTNYEVMVMKHICNANIKSISDFKALERGKDPVSALVATVLACPTTGLSGDAPSAGAIASPRSVYEFKVKGSTTTQQLADATYQQHKLCETDVNIDADKNGTIASSTCLDISHYNFMNVDAEDGIVTVQESDAPTSTRFGTVRFTPTELAQNNDKQSLKSLKTRQAKITLDMSDDTDGMVMLHVYNFRTDSDDNGNGNGNGGGNNVYDRLEKIKDRIQSIKDRIKERFGR